MLLGPSGSGKTTLLKTVNRLHVPDSGSIRVEGKDVKEWDVIRLRRNIGYAIQSVGLFPHYTVEQNVGLLLRLEGIEAGSIRRRVEELLELVGLRRELLHRYPRQLSGGEQHRVGIARALAAKPSVLLFDEPFGALDPITRSQLQSDFYRLARELRQTVLFVTHDLHEALRLGDKIAFLDRGVLRGIFTPEGFEGSADPEVRRYMDAFRDTLTRRSS